MEELSFNLSLTTLFLGASIATQLYLISAIILFLCLGWMALMAFDILVQEIKSFCKKYIRSAAVNDFKKIVQWKRKHIFVCEFIDQINQCFGAILLIFIIKLLISITNYGFGTIETIKLKKTISYENIVIWIIAVKNLIYLFLITSLSEKINQKVI